MNKCVCHFLDHVLLYLLHQKRSHQYQFSHSLDSLSSKDPITLLDFYPPPRIPEITFEEKYRDKNYQVGRYLYASEVRSEDIENDLSTGTYYENLLEKQNVHVIFVHGWRMNGFDRIKQLFLDRFMDLGLNMYFFTLPYHLERTPEYSLYGGEFMVSADIHRTLLAVRQAVTDVRALIYWLKKHRGGKVVLIGMSLGGFLTNLLSVVEDQIDVLVSVLYANSIAYSVWNTVPGKYIKRDLEHHGFTYEQLQQSWAVTEPSRFQPKVIKENILLLSGLYDQFVLPEDTDRLWEAWGKPKRINYACGHAGLGLYKKKIAEDVVQFLKLRLRG